MPVILRRPLLIALLACLLAVIVSACDNGAPTQTPILPSPTVAATSTTEPSATSEPSITAAPPTATNEPPTATTAPTNTAVPSTSTAEPPTATNTVAPTATEAPPTATAAPSDTPLPTVTPRSTSTARPTATSEPPTATEESATATEEPATATSEPESTATSGTDETPATTDVPAATPTRAPATPLAVTTPLIVSAAPGKKMVALTFDAGAGRGRVADILATLRQYHVHITFFLTGQWSEQNPDMVRAIVADGNEVANHSYDHPYFTKLSDQEMIDEIAQCEQIVQGIAGVSTKPYFRPPYGDYNKHVLNVVAAQGYQPIYWTFDSLDSVGQPKTKDFIIKRVTENNYEMDGAIVLQHMAADGSADALPTEIERLEARGLKIVPLSELLK